MFTIIFHLKFEQMFGIIIVSLPVASCENRGVHIMNYKELIIKLLEKITDEQMLKCIYIFVSKLAHKE